MLAEIARGIVDLFVPAACDICDGDAADGPCGRICAGCWAAARPRPAAWAPGAPVVAGPYDGPLGLAVRLMKFRDEAGLAEPLGAYMAEALLGRGPVEADAVTAVPLGAARLRLRGFDQARLLAEAVARRLGLPLRDLLRRPRETAPQSGLAAEDRRRNVRGAFEADDARGLRILLVDDVVTTSATAAEAAAALRRAGAASVTVLAAAEGGA